MNQNKTHHTVIDNEQTNKINNNIEFKQDLAARDKEHGANDVAEKISELKVDQVEEKSKNSETNPENKERNINTKSLVQ